MTATIDLEAEAARMHSAAKQVAQMFYVFPVDNPTVPYCDGVGKGHNSRACTERGKHPACKWGEWGTQDPAKVERYFTGRPHNIGIDCGKSAIVVIDEDTEGEWGRLCADLGVESPTTFTVHTARGRHLYFRQPEGDPLTNKEGAIRGYKINVRGAGGFVVGPGSLHASGVIYKIAKPLAAVLPVPDWLIDALKAKPTSNGKHGETGNDRDWWRSGAIAYGSHHNAIVAAAGWGRRMGLTLDETKPYIRDVLARCVDSGYTEEAAFAELEDVYGRYEAGDRLTERRHERDLGADGGDDQQHQDQDLALADGHRATDVGNADRLAALADGHIRYVHAWQKWIVYHDGAWRIDAGDALITELAKAVARNMFRRAAELGGDSRDAMWKWAKRSETTPSIRAMVHLTRGIPGVLVDHTDLDQQPWLLNVANGTIDLRTGNLIDHNPEHLLTKIIPITYDTTNEAPQFTKFLERIMPDQAVRSYLHRFVGYAATGLIREHVFPIWWGDGSNGKSTLIGLIRSALGDYAISAARDLFMASKYESHDTKYADLFGRRLATRTETRDGGNLDEARVKELTGGDPMKGRRMREDYWEFEPSHKLVLATNHKPGIEGTDHAIWRRVHLVPFTETIIEPELDPELPEKLEAELPGILTWIVLGCLAWQKDGLAVPDKVAAATAAYRGESDLVARFLDESGIELRPDDEGAWERSSTLTDAHNAWCSDNGLDHNRQWQLTTERLRELGAKPQKRQGVRGWTGVYGGAG